MLHKSTSHLDSHPALPGPMFQPPSSTAFLHNASPDRATVGLLLELPQHTHGIGCICRQSRPA